VDWYQANQYAKFMAAQPGFEGARLPSEAEYEYAATSGGKNEEYPKSNEDANCDKAAMSGNGGYGCGTNGTMPVCSKPAENTAPGMCDMVGSVWEWIEDTYQGSYVGAPTDGSAVEMAGSSRVLRGGPFYRYGARYLRADYRNFDDPGYRNVNVGFRLAK
jgi:formylglycine-generating enzyme required for sulfatase activity